QSNTISVSGTFSDLVALEEVEIYPNPASNQITITNAQNSKLYIYNIAGQLIKTIDNSDNKLDIDISNLADGLYTIKIVKDGIVLIKRIMIE
ncbi:MAG: T9SS type A sorting domain-containing protein, partial [Bacteroidales bacterium]|nr:T9SS type A sorting domain-containing protein [Bacteroidales bacterium]